MTSANNLKQMGLACHTLHGVYGKLPPTVGAFPLNDGLSSFPDWGNNGTPAKFGTQFYFLLPYIEQEPLFKSISNHSYTSNAVVKTYQAPADPSMPANGLTWGSRGACSYKANWHVFRGGWGEDGQVGGITRFPMIRDGLSQTIFFTEAYTVCGLANASTPDQYCERIWGEDGQNAGPIGYHYTHNVNFAPSFFAPVYLNNDNPNAYKGQGVNAPLPQITPLDAQCDPVRVQGFYAGGILVGLGDGSSRLVSVSVSQVTWGRAVEPSDGLPLGADW
jgi:hypothetical protein